MDKEILRRVEDKWEILFDLVSNLAENDKPLMLTLSAQLTGMLLAAQDMENVDQQFHINTMFANIQSGQNMMAAIIKLRGGPDLQ